MLSRFTVVLRRVIVGIAFAWVLGTSPAEAEICEHKCEVAVGCSGGCVISDTQLCACAAWGGSCNYKCRWFGPGCPAGIEGECDHQPPPVGPISEGGPSGDVSWVLLLYPDNAEGAGVEVLAASDSAFAERTLEARRASADDEAVPRPGRLLVVKPNVPCMASFDATLDTETGHRPIAEGEMMEFYFSATAGPDGRIQEVEPLFSTRPGSNESVSAFIAKKLEVTPESYSPEPASSVRFFGVLHVFEDDIAYALTGAHQVRSGSDLIPGAS